MNFQSQVSNKRCDSELTEMYIANYLNIPLSYKIIQMATGIKKIDMPKKKEMIVFKCLHFHFSSLAKGQFEHSYTFCARPIYDI